MIEEHVDNDLDNAINYKSQQVWGVRYIDDAVAKKINRDNDNDWDDDAKSEFYYLTDAMFSVRALLNNSGAVAERIDYTPYGVAMHRYASDINQDGMINFFDVGDFLVAHAATDPGAAGYDPDADSGGDGLNFFDVGDFLENHAEHADSVPDADVPDGWISNPGFGNDADNSIGYDGYVFDFAGATDGTTSGVYMVRNRVYGPGFGGWLERDPLGYAGGRNLYGYVESSPVQFNDPMGLKLTINGTPRFKTKIETALNEMCPDGDFEVNSNGEVVSNNEEFISCEGINDDDMNPELCDCLRKAMKSDQDIRINPYMREGGEYKNDDIWMPDDPNDPWGDGIVFLGRSLKKKASSRGRYEDDDAMNLIYPYKNNAVPWDLPIGLAHELCAHAIDNLDHRNPDKSPSKDAYSEMDSVIIQENIYREELGPGYGVRTGR